MVNLTLRFWSKAGLKNSLWRQYVYLKPNIFNKTNTDRNRSLLHQSGHRPLNLIFRLSSYGTTDHKNEFIETNDIEILNVLSEDMKIIPNFLTIEEENSLAEEAGKSVKRLRYEFDHWDNAIHGYRETEKRNWNEVNSKIIQKVRQLAFIKEDSPLAFVHVLDLAKDGYIKPHIDAVRFCGDTIAGMCLLSPCVMKLVMDKDKTLYGNCYLPQRSLYIMKNRARYEFTHEVLKDDESYFNGNYIPKDRRISVVCRNEPRHEDTL